MTVGRAGARRARGLRTWRALAATLLSGAVLALAACGGGDRENEYEPQRLVVLGDENSLILPDGSKYTVNALEADTADPEDLDCRANRIWVQVLADRFGIVFAECNPNAVATPRGHQFAAVEATVADLAAQEASARMLPGGLGNDDLVTVMVGQHDVLGLHAQVLASTRTRSDALTAALAAGEALAAEVNRLANSGPPVLVATVFNQGRTPFGRSQADNGALLSELTAEFNRGLRRELLNRGELIGLVQADELVQAVLNNPDRFDQDNASAAYCATPTPDCTTADFDTSVGANANNFDNFLWADGLHLSVRAHDLIGDRAVDRTETNPF